MKKELISDIQNKTAVIGIAGLGYVGLPLAIGFCEAGFKVIGFDNNKNKIKQLNCGQSYIEHIPSEKVAWAIKNGFVAVEDLSLVSRVDAIILCVPTPLNKNREPDMRFVFGTINALLPHIKKGQIMSLESTTYPGTTDEEIKPMIESKGYKIGQDYFLVFSPEREDPGNKKYTIQTIPKVCGGLTPDCLEVGTALYSQVVDKIVPVSSTKTAELTKLLENIHRAVNIGLVNEMKIVADKMGIDIWEVIRAAATKPFGFVPYYPGPGWGGHCVPVDPFYLTWKAKQYGVNTRFIELAGEINDQMPQWVIEKTIGALRKAGKTIKGCKILILGVAYKKDIDDIRESPALRIISLLREQRALVEYSDPHVTKISKLRRYDFDMASIDLNPESIASFDCVLLITDHNKFDYKMIGEKAKLIIDTRGAFPNDNVRVIKA